MDESADCRSNAVLVVGVDFRARSRRALAHALQMLARGVAREVHAVHVLEGDAAHDRALHAGIPDAIAQLAVDVGGASVGETARGGAWAHVRNGVVAYELRRLAFDVGADLIVIGERSGSLDTDRAVERDPLAPFSVLVAGRNIVLDSRGFECTRCDVCRRIRLVPGTHEPWCDEHARPGASARRIGVDPDLAESPRLVH